MAGADPAQSRSNRVINQLNRSCHPEGTAENANEQANTTLAKTPQTVFSCPWFGAFDSVRTLITSVPNNDAQSLRSVWHLPTPRRDRGWSGLKRLLAMANNRDRFEWRARYRGWNRADRGGGLRPEQSMI